MGIKEKFKSAVLGSALLASTACSGIKVKPGFNGLYAAGHVEREEGYVRMINDVSVGTDDVRVKYHGLNELSGSGIDAYFGRNLAGVEIDNNGVEALVDVKTTEKGPLSGQPYFGIRDNNIIKKFGVNYGWLQATTNGENINFTSFFGKNLGFLGNKFSPLTVEFFNTCEYRPNSKDSNLTEILLDWKLSDDLSLFVRQDTKSWDFKNSQYLVGGIFKF